MTQLRKPNGKFGGKAPEISQSEIYWISKIMEPEEEQQPAPPAPIMFTENQLVFLVSAGIVFGAFMGYFAH